jgi:hypothetical protein
MGKEFIGLLEPTFHQFDHIAIGEAPFPFWDRHVGLGGSGTVGHRPSFSPYTSLVGLILLWRLHQHLANIRVDDYLWKLHNLTQTWYSSSVRSGSESKEGARERCFRPLQSPQPPLLVSVVLSSGIGCILSPEGVGLAQMGNGLRQGHRGAF